jgi:hypothetical protein
VPFQLGLAIKKLKNGSIGSKVANRAILASMSSIINSAETISSESDLLAHMYNSLPYMYALLTEGPQAFLSGCSNLRRSLALNLNS